MIHRYSLPALLVGVVFLSTASAQNVVKLMMSDVNFSWKRMPNGTAMCGYMILGNHLSHDNPKIEWDINIDEIVQGTTRVVGVSAGTFTVNDKSRTPRSPITELSFTTEDDPTPVAVRFIGGPNSDNGVRGFLELESAMKLLKAISDERDTTANVKYDDGTSEVLQFGGYVDRRKFGGGKNSRFEECLRGRTPRIANPRPVP
jgi:hypothetical protein